MDSRYNNELASIKQELSSIIRELDSISNGVRNDYSGVGNTYCSNCIDSVTNNYQSALRKLNNLDKNVVTKYFANLHK